MAYSLSWSRSHPGTLIYLVDLSGSMKANGKIERVSNTIWRVLNNVIDRLQQGDTIYEYLRLYVIGYNQYTYDLFPDGTMAALNGHLDKTYSDEGTSKCLFFDVNEFKAQGLTHMAMAFDKAAEIVKKRISQIGRAIPAPMVINITDGYPEEKDMDDIAARQKALKAAEILKSIAVDDGNVLLFNIHIDGKEGEGAPLRFPTKVAGNDEGLKFLFDSASVVPGNYVACGKENGLQELTTGSRLMVSNISSSDELLRLISWGSSPASSARPRETAI